MPCRRVRSPSCGQGFGFSGGGSATGRAISPTCCVRCWWRPRTTAKRTDSGGTGRRPGDEHRRHESPSTTVRVMQMLFAEELDVGDAHDHGRSGASAVMSCPVSSPRKRRNWPPSCFGRRPPPGCGSTRWIDQDADHEIVERETSWGMVRFKVARLEERASGEPRSSRTRRLSREFGIPLAGDA